MADVQSAASGSLGLIARRQDQKTLCIIFPMPEATHTLWICTACGMVYDPTEGDPDGGIPPGTAFEDIPDNWFCPVCGARKGEFEAYVA